MRVNAIKIKAMTVEHRQAVLLDGEPLEKVEKLKYLGAMNVANGDLKPLSGRRAFGYAQLGESFP